MPKPRRKPFTASEALELRQLKARLRALKQVQAKALKDVTTSRRNRILRAAQPDDVLSVIARVRAKSKARELQYSAALKAARITKRDRARTVIFDTAGRRYPDFSSVPAKIKVYLIMVGPRGGLRLINPDDPSTLMRGVKAQPLPLVPRDFRFDKLVKIAPKKFRETMSEVEQASRRKQGFKTVSKEELQVEVERTAPVDIGKNGDIEKFYEKAMGSYVKAVRSFQDLTDWGFDMLILVRGEKKVFRLQSQQIPAHRFFKVTPAPGNRRKIVYRNNNTSAKALKLSIRYMANELIRSELRIRGLVSQGSASRISRLPFNKGLAKTEWRDKNGSRWRGAGLKPVSIRRIQYRLFRVV